MSQAGTRENPSVDDADEKDGAAEDFCRSLDVETCVPVAYDLFDDPKSLGDRSTAVEVLKELCEKGSQEGCRRLAMVHGELGDDARSFAAHRAGCALGDSDACVVAAERMISGRGTPKSAEEGLRSLNALCDANNCSACLAVYELYVRGHGDIAADPERALEAESRVLELPSCAP